MGRDSMENAVSTEMWCLWGWIRYIGLVEEIGWMWRVWRVWCIGRAALPLVLWAKFGIAHLLRGFVGGRGLRVLVRLIF